MPRRSSGYSRAPKHQANKVISVFKAPKAHGVGPASWRTSVGKASQAWRNPKKPPNPKGWKPYG